MAEKTIERRRLLHGAGAAAGGAAVVGMGVMAAQPAAASGGSGTLEGSWLVDVQQPDGSTLVSVGSFADGGVAITHDISPAGPPFTGSWAQHSHQWRATLWSGFPGEGGPGTPGPTARLRLRGEVRADQVSGTFTFTIFVPGADPESISGTFTGSRIEA
ncbi:hypothetical protein EV643_104254 [Kribbella sp. VKM Ac-2527]|uniref:Uncharacterized protein n=1 Tax=Kribbella caucasensis TaxID=2512215 RepID=A0A4R6KLT0_9ACTN|nr:hypothetical protein [Kribbella sp. VKM Ac-2527]TDO50756.1 hypothetical protein EV643_104254 [Kribbella sp. VKM Ac-2527]